MAKKMQSTGMMSKPSAPKSKGLGHSVKPMPKQANCCGECKKPSAGKC